MSMDVKKRAQSLVELAMVLPIILMALLVCLQYGLLFFAHLSVMNAGRDAGRWVAVHPHNTDVVTEGRIKDRLPANLDPNRLQIFFSPACTAPDGTAGAECPNRQAGDVITTTLRYNASSLIFFPSRFGVGGPVGAVTIPENLPDYTVWTMAERASPQQ